MKKIFSLILLLSLILWPLKSLALDITDWKLLELREAFFDYKQLVGAVDPYLTPTYHPSRELNGNINLDLLEKIGFADIMVHSRTDNTQFRLVGLFYKTGFHIGDSVDIYYEHFSKHLTDFVPVMSNVYDAICIRIYLYKQRKSRYE